MLDDGLWPAVCGGEVEVAGAAAEAAHVAYPGGGVREAFQLLHGKGSAGGCINFVRGCSAGWLLKGKNFI